MHLSMIKREMEKKFFICSCTFSRKNHNIFVSVVWWRKKNILSPICDLIQSLKRNTLLALGKLNCWNSAHLSVLPHSAFIFFLIFPTKFPVFIFPRNKKDEASKRLLYTHTPSARRSGKAKIPRKILHNHSSFFSKLHVLFVSYVKMI